MGVTGLDYDSVDDNLAANLRLRREAAQLSQDELAQRMTERGFGFSQATIWKIEQGKRPVRISEAVALGDALGMLSWASLLDHPDRGSHEAALENGHRKAAAAYQALQAATRSYLFAQVELGFSVSEARDAGVPVHELWKSYLDEPAERAVITARVAFYKEDEHHVDIADEADKVMTSLREHGYEPLINPDDVVRHPVEPTSP